ncbi:hypothetical protein A8924_0579 [Saccharopolyspora erythraea NRRL 2338]|nr:hypothetical protein N599_00965 [Saccharopolyspora erythraea D]PFG93345.1 hypothetical protein A8924_0579 [Saccharopolyspora erythraea NRRL 2338]
MAGAIATLPSCGHPALRVEGPAPVLTPPPADVRPEQLANIRNVDIRRTLLTDPAVSQGVKETLEACGACGLADPVYTDLTADGEDDLVVRVDSGGSGGMLAAYVYSVRESELRQVFAFEGLDFDVRVSDGKLEVVQAVFAPDDPHCCPSSHETRTYAWNGERLV